MCKGTTNKKKTLFTKRRKKCNSFLDTYTQKIKSFPMDEDDWDDENPFTATSGCLEVTGVTIDLFDEDERSDDEADSPKPWLPLVKTKSTFSIHVRDACDALWR